MDAQFGQNTISTTLVSTTKHRYSGDFESDPKRPRLEETGDSKINPNLMIPQYDAFQHLIAVYEPNLDEIPRGISIDEDRGHIYIANGDEIMIFSETGDAVAKFHCEGSYGVLAVEDRVYVTVKWNNELSMFSIPDYQMLSYVRELGSGKEQFHLPHNLTLSPDKLIYIADCFNNRLQILDCNLHFKGSFRHHSMVRPVDVKFSHSQLFVMTDNSPCLHIFTLSGEFVRSIITRMGFSSQIVSSCFFCLDAHNNIVISDYLNIKVFSSEGKLLQIIVGTGPDRERFRLEGIAILRQTKLVSVSLSEEGEELSRLSSRLSIFST